MFPAGARVALVLGLSRAFALAISFENERYPRNSQSPSTTTTVPVMMRTPRFQPMRRQRPPRLVATVRPGRSDAPWSEAAGSVGTVPPNWKRPASGSPDPCPPRYTR